MYLYLDTRTSERRRGARVGVRLLRARARVRPRRAASASRYNRRSRMHRCAYQAHKRVCACNAWRLYVASARSSQRPPIVARRARAARARGARQVHLLHEGQGAPRVARPVQALAEPVRPAGRSAALRVRGGAGAGCRATPRSVVYGGGGAVGSRPSPACACLASAADRRAVGGGPEPPGAAARLARRSASNTELAALPAAVDWPFLSSL
jgi:hypothetical protein